MVKILKRLVTAEKRLRAFYNVAPDSPENRRKAQIYMLWFDHEVLRKRWTNLHQIAPGVFRSNQPTFERLEEFKAQGIDAFIQLNLTRVQCLINSTSRTLSNFSERLMAPL